MSKTARIITATLLTIATIALVAFGVKKAKQNKRTIPTYAMDWVTNFTNIKNYKIVTFSDEVEPPNNNMTKYSYTAELTSTDNNKLLKILPNQYTIGQETFHTQQENLANYTYSWTTEKPISSINITGSRTIIYMSQSQTLIHQYSIKINYQDGSTPTTTTLNLGQNHTFATTPPQIIPYAVVFTTTMAVYGNIKQLQDTKDFAYQTGYNTSEAFNHPIALQPLMLNILTMPFTFITQAFDITLWPETAYEFNLANFIKGIIAIFAILFIIKMFTSGFSIVGNYTNNAQERKLNKSKIQVNKATARRQNKLADKGK